MAYTLDQFCKDAHRALSGSDDRAGREQVRKDLERLLANPEFVEATCGAAAKPGRHTLYRDPDLDFCVLAHINVEARKSPPTDHGPSWAVYGQTVGHTDMTEWIRLAAASAPFSVQLEPHKRYPLTPGQQGTFQFCTN